MKNIISTAVLVSVVALVESSYGWSNRDIGNPWPQGSAFYDPYTSTWTVTADGNDIWDYSDNCHYVYKCLKGDGQITARVLSITGTSVNEWAKAGFMIRETLAADSKHAMMVMTPTMGHAAAFQWRDTTGGVTRSSHGGLMTLPYWIRIERTGDTFSGYNSYDGVTWVQQGSAVTIPMNESVYCGLVVTSHSDGLLCTAKFDSMNITGDVVLTPTFTYQGRLLDADKPADGLHNFQFKLYDVSIGGTQQGRTNTIQNVEVIDGYFTVELDFGLDVFDGDSRWLEIDVWSSDSNDPNASFTLNPRQEVTATPYATYAQTAADVEVPLILTGSVAYPGAVVSAINTSAGLGSGTAIYGVHSKSGNQGGLGQIIYGAWGADANGNNFGGLGGYNYGVYGISQKDNGIFGESDISNGVYGQNTTTGNNGRLGNMYFGAYGIYNSTGNFGILGHVNVGVYGKHGSTENYGELGLSKCGVYGKGVADCNGVVGISEEFGSGVVGKNILYTSEGHLGTYFSGVQGESPGNGVLGNNTWKGTGGKLGSIDAGVEGWAGDSDTFAGWFIGDVEITGNVWVEATMSAATVVDRTPYPKDLETAYEAVMSMKRLPDGQYNEKSKED